MSALTKGSFSVNLGVFSVQAEVSDDDRQCAWELYTELCTRTALVGKSDDAECRVFEGEVLAESLDSVHSFFREARGIMRRFPVGRLSRDEDRHLGRLINELMLNVMRPFLERWQADFRHWWEADANPRLAPFERQKEYPLYNEFLQDWTDLRMLVRALVKTLVDAYQLGGITSVPA